MERYCTPVDKLLSWSIPTALFALVFLVAIESADAGGPDWAEEAMATGDTITFDREAEAAIFLNEAEVEISDDGRAQRKVWFLGKLLARGGDDYLTVTEIISPRRKVGRLKGWHITPDGKSRSLKSEWTAEVDFDAATGYYDDYRVLVARFPEVDVGDYVAFEYRINEDHEWDSHFQEFLVQRRIPVVSTRLVVKIPRDWQLRSTAVNLTDSLRLLGGDYHEFKCGLLPYRPSEPFMPDWDQLERRIRFVAYDPASEELIRQGSWRGASGFAWQLMDAPARPVPDIELTAEETCAGATTVPERIEAVARFVRDEIRYVAVEIGEGRFQPRPASVTLSNRYGDCKDKVALMRSLLASVDIPSVPVLANYGEMISDKLPTPFQFNHCIVAVPLDGLSAAADSLRDQTDFVIADNWLYYDPTAEQFSLGQLPTSLHGSWVLKLTDPGSDLQRLPALPPEYNQCDYNAEATLHEDGSVSAEVRITCLGNWAAVASHDFLNTDMSKQIEEYTEMFAETMRSPSVSDLGIEGDGDSVCVTFTVTGSGYLTSAGSLLLMKPDCFHVDPSAVDSRKERVHPISFGSPRLISTHIDWQLPDGWHLAEPVDSVHAECDLAVYDFAVATSPGGLSFSERRLYRGNELPARRFADVIGYRTESLKGRRCRVVLAKE